MVKDRAGSIPAAALGMVAQVCALWLWLSDDKSTESEGDHKEESMDERRYNAINSIYGKYKSDEMLDALIKAYDAGFSAANQWTPAETPPTEDGNYLCTLFAEWDINDYQSKEVTWKQIVSFNDGKWDEDGVIAWREPPPPFNPEEARQ